MSELCNCIFFSLSLGGRKEKRIRPRLNETAQSCSASEAQSKQTMLIILYHSSPATAAAMCVLSPTSLLLSAPCQAVLSLHPRCTQGQQPSFELCLTSQETQTALETDIKRDHPKWSRKSSCIAISTQTCWDSPSCYVLISCPSWETSPSSSGDLLCAFVCT